MSNGITDEVREMLAGGELPAKVSQRMLLALLVEISKKLDASIEQNQTDHKCFQETTELLVDYPTIAWLFAHKPIKTIGMAILVFTVLMGLYTAGILKVFGLAVGVNLP